MKIPTPVDDDKPAVVKAGDDKPKVLDRADFGRRSLRRQTKLQALEPR